MIVSQTFASAAYAAGRAAYLRGEKRENLTRYSRVYPPLWHERRGFDDARHEAIEAFIKGSTNT